jgi:hypothetical protein
MKNRFLLALSVAFTFGSMAHAATPQSPAIIGEIDGILSSCSKIDPRDEDKFEKLRRSLIPGPVVRVRAHEAPHGAGSDDDDNRKAMEKNPAYRANFVWMQTIFSEMAKDQALKLCKAAI